MALLLPASLRLLPPLTLSLLESLSFWYNVEVLPEEGRVDVPARRSPCSVRSVELLVECCWVLVVVLLDCRSSTLSREKVPGP